MLELKCLHLAASNKIMNLGGDHHRLLTSSKGKELVIKCPLNGLHTPAMDPDQASNSPICRKYRGLTNVIIQSRLKETVQNKLFNFLNK